MSECALCGSSTDEPDQLCERCSDGLAATVRMLPVRTPPPPGSDLTAYVERYRPPVPPARTPPGPIPEWLDQTWFDH